MNGILLLRPSNLQDYALGRTPMRKGPPRDRTDLSYVGPYESHTQFPHVLGYSALLWWLFGAPDRAALSARVPHLGGPSKAVPLPVLGRERKFPPLWCWEVMWFSLDVKYLFHIMEKAGLPHQLWKYSKFYLLRFLSNLTCTVKYFLAAIFNTGYIVLISDLLCGL